jgi:hypothetical protein
MVVEESTGATPMARLANPHEQVTVVTRLPTFQRWQVTPITKANVPVATIQVAGAPAPQQLGGGESCFASAQGMLTTAPP